LLKKNQASGQFGNFSRQYFESIDIRVLNTFFAQMLLLDTMGNENTDKKKIGSFRPFSAHFGYFYAASTKKNGKSHFHQ